MNTVPKAISEIKKPRKQYQKRSLVAKLAEVFRQIEMVEKKGVTTSYEYLRACDLYRATRGLLMERNVLIFPNILSEYHEDVEVEQDNVIKKLSRCTVKAKFVLEDGDSGETRACEAIGVSVGDHTALAAAITCAEKSMLKGMGMIVDEAEDPEFDQAANTPKQLVGKIKDMRKTALTLIVGEQDVKVKVEDEALANRLHANKGEDVKLDYFERVNGYGKPYKLLTNPQNVVLGKFQAAAKANPSADLTTVLEISKEQAELLKFMEREARQHFGESWSDRLAEIIGHSDVHKLTESEITEICDRIQQCPKPPQPVVSIAEGTREDEVAGD